MARYETKTQAGTTIALEWVPVESPPAGVVVNEVTGRPVCAQFLIRFPNGRAVPGAYLLLPPRTGDPDAQGPDHALERIKRAAEVCERAQDWIPPNATLIVGTTAPKVFIDTNADLRSPLWIAQTTERYQMHTILDYDFEPDANTISVTELVNNDVRAIALGRQMPFLPRDITELSAPIGQIMHRVAELPPLVVKDGANNVVVRVIPEQRLAVQIDGITLSGRPDAILEMPDGVVVVDTKTFPGQVYPTSIPKGWLEEHGAAHLADKRLIEIVHERPWLAQAWLLEWLENQRPTFF
ncbi:MAG: hypothetical protein KatS3mg082_1449 [Nitrospiraceae bacterium]|nr:MAG: hypothetical protein KatS3mg082_1449 [Nitrospiraceae bacterium]